MAQQLTLWAPHEETLDSILGGTNLGNEPFKIKSGLALLGFEV